MFVQMASFEIVKCCLKYAGSLENVLSYLRSNEKIQYTKNGFSPKNRSTWQAPEQKTF